MNTVKRLKIKKNLSDFSRKLQENSFVPEYSGISLILSIERVTPGIVQYGNDGFRTESMQYTNFAPFLLLFRAMGSFDEKL